tara:strand:+ start:4456 stop:5376 length:921 start_codon:yes stop_codon:yes gene_type:complete
MVDNNAPVIIFAYNRFNLLKNTISHLKKNLRATDTNIFIFIDGPKNVNDTIQIDKINKYLLTLNGFKTIKILNNKINLGLKKSILDGINYIFKKYEKIIVLEDDIQTSKYFLEFINRALDMYKDEESVCQVSGYSYLEKYFKNNNNTSSYFLKGGDCLAWGTWKRAWKIYEDDSIKLYNKIKKNGLIREFDRQGSSNFSNDLKSNSQNQKSWAINWYASTFLLNMYTLYPLKSLALHIVDHEQESTNYKIQKNDPLKIDISDDRNIPVKIKVETNYIFERYYQKFLKSYKEPLFTRLIRKVSNFFN